MCKPIQQTIFSVVANGIFDFAGVEILLFAAREKFHLSRGHYDAIIHSRRCALPLKKNIYFFHSSKWFWFSLTNHRIYFRFVGIFFIISMQFARTFSTHQHRSCFALPEVALVTIEDKWCPPQSFIAWTKCISFRLSQHCPWRRSTEGDAHERWSGVHQVCHLSTAQIDR